VAPDQRVCVDIIAFDQETCSGAVCRYVVSRSSAFTPIAEVQSCAGVTCCSKANDLMWRMCCLPYLIKTSSVGMCARVRKLGLLSWRYDNLGVDSPPPPSRK
jgi:hypothetical protein